MLGPVATGVYIMPISAVDLKLPLSTTQQRVLGSNPARAYALLVNDGTDDIYLGMGIPAVANRGIRLNNGGGSYEINATNPFHGDIYAVATAGAPNLLIQEW